MVQMVEKYPAASYPPHVCPECSRSFAWGEDADSQMVVGFPGLVSCGENAHWKLQVHFQQEHADKGFLCGRRSESLRPQEGIDFWRKHANGDRVCSYCGSLHPEDFKDILERYANGEEGYRFSTTDKGYKFYANRPGVPNATEGGIKFYTPHLPIEGTPEWDALQAVYGRAIERYRAEIKARFG